MRKFIFTFFATFAVALISAQTYVERVLILNEGYFDYITNEIVTPVSIGAFDPELNTYAVIDEVENARFASDIRIDGNYYYVAADKYLLKYDLFTNELINSTEIEGIRKIAFWNDYIIVTRGEYMMTFDAYIQAYDKNTLDFIFDIPTAEIPHAAEGVVVRDGIAYVAVNNGFEWGAEVGYIAMVDLYTQTLTGTIDLGANGKNPDNLMISGDNIYTLNNKDFTGSSVSNYKIGTGDITTNDLINVSSGCGTSVYFDGNIYYQEMFNSVVTKYDPAGATIVDETDFTKSFYAIAFDELNSLMYASETDFYSYGKVHVYEIDGELIHTFDAGVSPGNMAMDIRIGSSVENAEINNFHIYPNPAIESIFVEGENITIYNGTGIRMIEAVANNSSEINISNLPAGIYFVKSMVGDVVYSGSFTKF